jgi:type I restriction enzyme R subunit
VAPLNKWRSIRKSGHESAYQFDLLVARLEAELLAGSSAYQDFKDRFDVLVAALLPSLGLNQVREKEATIKEVRSSEFWDGATVEGLERARRELRDIMRFRRIDLRPRTGPKVVDVTEDLAEVRISTRHTKLEGLDLVQYRKQWKEALAALIGKSPALRKIRLCQPVDSKEIEDLAAQVHSQDEHLTLDDLRAYDPELPQEIDRALRRIVGLDAEAVDAYFLEFHAKNPSLTAPQTHFLRMIKNHIGRYGALEIDDLYEQPFTALHSEGLEGVFPDEEQVEALVGAIQAINALSSDSEREEENEVEE